MMSNFEIFMFSQSLNNAGADDWYSVSRDEVNELQSEEKRIQINNLLCLIMDNGKQKDFNHIKGFYLLTKDKEFNVVLLIPNKQKDIAERHTQTAIIISNLLDHSLPINTLLTQFLKKTNRDYSSDMVDELSRQCIKLLSILKKKGAKKKQNLLLLALFLLLAIVLIVLLKSR